MAESTPTAPASPTTGRGYDFASLLAIYLAASLLITWGVAHLDLWNKSKDEVAKRLLPLVGRVYDYRFDPWTFIGSESQAPVSKSRYRERVTLIQVDDTDLRELGQTWPVPYRFHADVVDELIERGPRSLFLDLNFQEIRDRGEFGVLMGRLCKLRAGGTRIFAGSHRHEGMLPNSPEVEGELFCRRTDGDMDEACAAALGYTRGDWGPRPPPSNRERRGGTRSGGGDFAFCVEPVALGIKHLARERPSSEYELVFPDDCSAPHGETLDHQSVAPLAACKDFRHSPAERKCKFGDPDTRGPRSLAPLRSYQRSPALAMFEDTAELPLCALRRSKPEEMALVWGNTPDPLNTTWMFREIDARDFHPRKPVDNVVSQASLDPPHPRDRRGPPWIPRPHFSSECHRLGASPDEKCPAPAPPPPRDSRALADQVVAACHNGLSGPQTLVSLLPKLPKALVVKVAPGLEAPAKNICPYHRVVPARFLLREAPDCNDKCQNFLLGNYLHDTHVIYTTHLVGVAERIQSPMHGVLPGAHLHAMALDNLLVYRERYKRAVELFDGHWDRGEPYLIGIILLTSLLLMQMPGGPRIPPFDERVRNGEFRRLTAAPPAEVSLKRLLLQPSWIVWLVAAWIVWGWRSIRIGIADWSKKTLQYLTAVAILAIIGYGVFDMGLVSTVMFAFGPVALRVTRFPNRLLDFLVKACVAANVARASREAEEDDGEPGEAGATP